MDITNELLAAYAEGNVSDEERLALRQYLTENPQEWDSMLMMMDEDYDITLDNEDIASLNTAKLNNNLSELLSELDSQESTSANFRILPVMAMAALQSDNLCALHCELYVLKTFGIIITDDELISIATKKRWLTPEGIALKNIGNLSEYYNLIVERKFHATIRDVKNAIIANKLVIVSVDEGELVGDDVQERQEDALKGKRPDHVVVVRSIGTETVTLIDPNTMQFIDTYSLERFIDAWEDSCNYMITISK